MARSALTALFRYTWWWPKQ